MVVRAQIPDLISGPVSSIGRTQEQRQTCWGGSIWVPSSLEISKEDSKGGLHSLKQGKNQGTKGREDSILLQAGGKDLRVTES